MRLENFFWWQYKPTDEREKELYSNAYSRTCKTLILFLLVGAGTLAGSSLNVSNNVIALLLLLAVTIAYFAGWTVIKDEEISLQRENRIHGSRLMHRDTPALRVVLPTIGMLFAVYGFVLLGWPTTVVINTLVFFVLVRVLLSVGAYSMTAHFEPSIRWLLVLCMPLTAIVLGQMKKRGVAVFIGAMLLSVAIYGVVLIFPVAAARSIVTPFVITTSTFAPELPKGAYRFVDERSFAKIAVNDFVIIKVDKWYVMKVLAVNGSVYTVKNDTLGERQVPRNEIVGRVMNQTSWFTAFIETQMPKQ